MNEQWIKWKPVKGLAPKYQIDYIVDKIDEFVILLIEAVHENRKVKVIFDHSIEAYRNTNKFYRGNILHDLSQKHGQQFWDAWTFFKVTNSSYLKWLSEESFKITSIMPVVHFSFITVDFITDVVSTYEPKIEFVPE